MRTTFTTLLLLAGLMATAPSGLSDGPGCLGTENPELCVTETHYTFGSQDCSTPNSVHIEATEAEGHLEAGPRSFDVAAEGRESCHSFRTETHEKVVAAGATTCDNGVSCSRVSAAWFERSTPAHENCDVVVVVNDGNTGVGYFVYLSDLGQGGCPAGPPPNPGWGSLVR